MKRIYAIITTVAAIAALGGALAAVASHDDSARAQLTTQISQLKRQLSAERADFTQLQAQVAILNAPADPLSAYNAVCNQTMTNDQTGISQTYYFPCTNQAQTIPQPGN